MKPSRWIFSALVALTAVSLRADVKASSASAATSHRSSDHKRAQAVVARWVKSLGGTAALKDVSAVHLEQRVDSRGRFSGMFFSSDEFANDHFHFEFTGGDTVSGGYDGKLAWYHSAALGFGRVGRDDFRTWIWRSDAIVARDLARYYPKFEYQGEALVDAVSCDVLTMTAADGRDELWYFQKKNGRLSKIVRPSSSQQYGFTATFTDYRKSGALMAPFRVTVVNASSSSTAERLNIDFAHTAEDNGAPPPHDLADYQRTEAILERYVGAVGGKNAIDAVHSRVTKSIVELSSSGVATHTIISEKDPNFVLREEQSPGLGTTFTGFDGQTGWVNSEAQGFHRLKDADVSQWKHRMKLEGELDLASQYPLHKYVGIREVDHRKTEVLALSTVDSFGGEFCFDIESGLLSRVEMQVNISPKKMAPATMDLSDYRAADGLKVPFKIVWRTSTNTLMTTLESIAFNVPLSDEIFKERRDD